MVINVLMAAAEAVPFIKVGGLGDVIGALPQELVRQKADIRVILPKYSDIPEEFTAQMEWVGQFFVPVGWRRQNCDLYRLVYNDVVFYFVGNDYYFARQGIYGFYDDGERYAFFCRAVLEALP
ncbi:MAG TPA: glycogen/starch synthase, partial [Negativicutes bacterium]